MKEYTQLDELVHLEATAYHLAMLGLQSTRYRTDPEFGGLVDKVLALTQQRVLHRLTVLRGA